MHLHVASAGVQTHRRFSRNLGSSGEPFENGSLNPEGP